jgi:predicted nuclease of predicted toxin-antitoxin system
MADRIRFITHQGKQILLVGLSNCSTAEVERIIRAVPEVVTTRPRVVTLILHS